MKRKVIIGLALVAVVGLVFGNTNVSKNAETSPPEPAAFTTILM